MEQVKKRNGTIELMRFIFCLIVILYHINNRMPMGVSHHFTFFEHGKVGVEFFFLVSGYLMTHTAKKLRGAATVPTTKRFMYRKLMSILPYHVIVFTFGFIVTISLMKGGFIARTIHAISTLPNFFLIQMSGMREEVVITPEWYISAMLWMMLLIFPLILKYQERFTKLVCPFIAVLLIGYMIHENHKLGGTSRFLYGGAVPKIYVRAFAEMCGGAFCYEVVQFVRRLHLTKTDRLLLTGVELVCYLLPVLYAMSDFAQAYEGYAFYSLAIAVTLSFSEVTLSAEAMKNKVNYFLGRFSLPLYFAQTVPFVIMKYVKSIKLDNPPEYVAAFCIILSVVAGLVLYFVAPRLMKAANAKIKRLRQPKEASA